jgi:hypothetical protein
MGGFGGDRKREKCAHDACRCQVGETGAYCSDHCRSVAAAGAQAELQPCMCGHPDCMTE